MSTSRPPDIIHLIGVPRPSLFLAALPLPCIILDANQRTKMGEAWEQDCFYSVYSETENLGGSGVINCMNRYKDVK